MKRQVKIDDCGDWRGLLFCRMLTLAVAVATVTLARADGTVLYVDAQCATPESPYATPATASTNLALAVAYARANDGAFEIRVKTGTYVETGFVLDKAIQVVGDTGNPADVAVSAESATVRAFTLSDADAAVKNLTVSGKGHRENSTTQFNGGHVNMSAGLVENCVITGSRPTGKTYGANVYMTGGRLVRCQVLDAYYNVDNGYYKSYGMGIYASGGTIESCLVKGNTAAGGSVFNGGVRLAGAVTMVNCTLLSNSSAYTYVAGIEVASASAKVVNTVVYNNGGTAEKEFGSSNLGRFNHCAATVTNASCATWTVITADDFERVVDGNYRPAVTGRLLDAGTRDADWIPASMSAYDLDGLSRVSGREIDVGCYETDQSHLVVRGDLSTYGGLEGAELTAAATAVGGGGTYLYKWDFGNGTERTTDLREYRYAYPTSGLFTVRVAASDDAGATWGGWTVLPEKIVIGPEEMFVDACGKNPVYPYKTAATAATRIFDAIGALTNNLSAGASRVDGVTVHVADGTYVETGIVLGSAVTVCGDSGSPTGVTVSAESETMRAFTLSDAGAAVKNLTVSGKGHRTAESSTDQFNGGHVNISAGLVENCVITGSRPNGKTYGGNVHMTGGKLLRCRVLDAYYNVDNGYRKSYGMGIYASGGTIESCLVKGNTAAGASVFNGGILLAGAATVVNCTVVGNSAANAYVAGIEVASASAKVVNTVLYDNGGTAAKEFGTSNLGRFNHCASTVTNDSCATWTLIAADDFVKTETGDYRPSISGRLLDAGTQDATWVPASMSPYDLDGLSRVSGREIDMGCYEADQSSLTVTGTLSSYGAIEGDEITASASAVGSSGSYVYKWDFGDGTGLTTGESECRHAYSACGLYAVRVAASENGGATWCDWHALPAKIAIAPETMFVDAAGKNPTYPYTNAATAATRILDAIGVLTNDVSDGASCVDGVTVHVANGTYVETGIALGSAVTVCGDSGSPADVTVSAESETLRAFTLSDAGAAVKNLTVSGKGHRTAESSIVRFNGGHVNISAGLVENCVITGSRPNGKTYGGNVYMTGGRLVRCQVLDAFYSESNGYRSSRGMGIFASGGTIESCLIKGNVAGNGSVFEGGVRLEGTATMVNCTLVGNRNTYADSSCVAGVAVASASAKVVNTVLYDNGGTATKEFGTSNLGCYEYSASSVTNASCATWRVIDAAAFKDYGRISADLSGLRPCGSPGTALVRTGCTALDYAEKCGAVSQRDLLGGRRIMGKRLDIGCIAGKPGGLALSIR